MRRVEKGKSFKPFKSPDVWGSCGIYIPRLIPREIKIWRRSLIRNCAIPLRKKFAIPFPVIFPSCSLFLIDNFFSVCSWFFSDDLAVTGLPSWIQLTSAQPGKKMKIQSLTQIPGCYNGLCCMSFILLQSGGRPLDVVQQLQTKYSERRLQRQYWEWLDWQ